MHAFYCMYMLLSKILKIRHYPFPRCWHAEPDVIVAVLCYNFVGDGVRDAADPFGHR